MGKSDVQIECVELDIDIMKMVVEYLMWGGVKVAMMRMSSAYRQITVHSQGLMDIPAPPIHCISELNPYSIREHDNHESELNTLQERRRRNRDVFLRLIICAKRQRMRCQKCKASRVSRYRLAVVVAVQSG